MTVRFDARIGLYGALLTAWSGMMGSLYFSEVQGFIPCTLCWYQRILLYPLAALIALGIWHQDQQLPYLVLPFSLLGQGVSIYHYLLQKTTLFAAPTTCSVAIPCTTAWINWFGFVTIPLLAMFGFMIITLGMLLIMPAKAETPMASNAHRPQNPWPRWPIPIVIAVVVGLYTVGVVRATQEQAAIPFPVIDDLPRDILSRDPVAEGGLLYAQACASCHGLQGEGISGLGSPLVGSAAVVESTDRELLALIRDGRPADAMENRSGMAMPPRGGRPDLSDAQILAIIRYLRAELHTSFSLPAHYNQA